jgi:hypothetical protein
MLLNQAYSEHGIITTTYARDHIQQPKYNAPTIACI